jgi:pimeloyl-ACP methyl ester carboxylesterase
MEQLVMDLAAIVDVVSPVERRAVIVGESFGGALTLSFALARAEQVSAIVILNSFPFFGPQLRLQAAIWGLQVMPWGAMGLVRRLTASRLHSRHTHREELAQFMALTALARRDGYINRLRLLRTYDVRHRLHELRAPALFLAAEQDHLIPSVEQARYMAARVPGAVVRVLAGYGHICLIAPDFDLHAILREWQDAAGHPA